VSVLIKRAGIFIACNVLAVLVIMNLVQLEGLDYLIDDFASLDYLVIYVMRAITAGLLAGIFLYMAIVIEGYMIKNFYKGALNGE
jgi:hypothetical protein